MEITKVGVIGAGAKGITISPYGFAHSPRKNDGKFNYQELKL